MLWNYNCIASDWKFIYDFSTVRTILVLFLKFNFCFSCNGFVYFCNSLCFSTSDCHYSSKHTISPNHVIHNVSDLLILFLTVSEINGEYRDMPLAYCGWLYQLTPSSLTIDCTNQRNSYLIHVLLSYLESSFQLPRGHNLHHTCQFRETTWISFWMDINPYDFFSNYTWKLAFEPACDDSYLEVMDNNLTSEWWVAWRNADEIYTVSL